MVDPFMRWQKKSVNLDDVSETKTPQDNWKTVVKKKVDPFQKTYTTQKPKVSANKITKKVKKWSKMSTRSFAIWCVFFVLLIFWWVLLAWASFIKNPDAIKSVWVEPAQMKDLLKVFAILFFGTLFLFWVSLIWLNWFKLTKAKWWSSKLKYWAWLFSWIILIIMSLLFGYQTVLYIQNSVTGKVEIKTNNMVDYFVMTKDSKPILSQQLNWFSVAPVNIRFRLNKDLFLWEFGKIVNSISYVNLSCWNGQADLSRKADYYFSKDCLYLNKWEYPIILKYWYLDKTTWERIDEEQQVLTLNIRSEISINKWNYTLNDDKSMIVVWSEPIKVQYDASEIFKDFPEWWYEISWDLNWDDSFDKDDTSKIFYEYDEWWLYNINYKLPKLLWDKLQFTFPILVEQSNSAKCKLQSSKITSTKYSFKWIFTDIEWDIDIETYNFIVEDLKSWKKIKETTKSMPVFSDKFEKWKEYNIKLIFTTSDWENWSCSTTLENAWSQFQLDYNFSSFIDGKEKSILLEDDTLVLDRIPVDLYLNIEKIITELDPEEYNMRVYLDWSPLKPIEKNKYEMTIKDLNEHELNIKFIDNKWNTTDNKINIIVEKKSLIWKLIANPMVWEEPLEVTLDASSTELNDKGDEIIYFTWDFGDWTKILKNYSEWIVTHQYYFDKENENGQYDPSVTVVTRNWYEEKIELNKSIFVKRPVKTVKINLDDNPTQVAKVWTIIPVSISADWLISSIVWDFGNWNTRSGNGREYANTFTTYEKEWTYTISVNVKYSDGSESKNSIKIKIMK